MNENIRTPDVLILKFEDRFAPDFARLSREWLERYFEVDDRDRAYIDHPRTAIIEKGGEVFFALLDGEVVGTCAAIRMNDEVIELAKLAVTPRAQGLGIGRMLSDAVLIWARDSGASKVVLVSSSILAPALRLYESMGFVYARQEGERWYREADVYMELTL